MEKIQKVKIQKLQELKAEEEYFYENVQYVIIKISKFIKQQKASGLSSSLKIKTPLSKIPLVGPLFLEVLTN